MHGRPREDADDGDSPPSDDGYSPDVLDSGDEYLASVHATANPMRRDKSSAESALFCWRMWTRLQPLVGLPGLWLLQLLRLISFVVLTSPVLVPQFLRYLAHPRVFKNIVYGPSFRHQLDVYAPAESAKGPRPVVIFISGGAWIIGYKVWPFLQALVLQANGVLVVSPDYRNFPQCAVDGMVDDVDAAVSWTLSHLRRLGGDPRNVTLVGQSAGAHLVAAVVARRAAREGSAACAATAAEPARSAWSLAQIARWVGVSGPYDLVQIGDTLNARGLDRRLLRRLIPDPIQLSPIEHVRALDEKGRARLAAVPCLLTHGKADKTVPWQQTLAFAGVLRRAGVTVDLEVYDGCSHTDAILEGPMSGSDKLMAKLLGLVRAQAEQAARAARAAGSPCGRCINDESQDYFLPRVLPVWVVALARWVNPF